MMVRVDRLVRLFLTKLRLVCDYRIILSTLGIGWSLWRERVRKVVCETYNAEKVLREFCSGDGTTEHLDLAECNHGQNVSGNLLAFFLHEMSVLHGPFKTHFNVGTLLACLPEQNLGVAVPTLFRRWSDTMWDSGCS
jgi:hypothetical protein